MGRNERSNSFGSELEFENYIMRWVGNAIWLFWSNVYQNRMQMDVTIIQLPSFIVWPFHEIRIVWTNKMRFLFIFLLLLLSLEFIFELNCVWRKKKKKENKNRFGRGVVRLRCTHICISISIHYKMNEWICCVLNAHVFNFGQFHSCVQSHNQLFD